MKKIFTLVFLSLSIFSHAQDGTLDHTFGTDGKAFTNDIDGAGKILVQPDNKILQLVTPYTDHQIYGVIRLNANGTPDNSFGVNGLASGAISPFIDNNLAMGLQPDGKILLGGQSYTFDQETFADTAHMALLRFTSSGVPDLSFNGTGSLLLTVPGFDLQANEIKIQPDGKILVIGTSEIRQPYSFHTFMARFNVDGSVDNSFGTNGKVDLSIGTGNNLLTSAILFPDGKIMLAGHAFTGSPSHLSMALARFDASGNPDASFGTAGKLLIDAAPTSSFASAIALQPDGKVIVSGNSKYYSYSDDQFTTLRLNNDGSLDPTFGGTGILFEASSNNVNNKINSVLVQNDGKILLGGAVFFYNIITQQTTSNFTLIRYTPGGIKDVTFKSDTEVLQTGTTGGSGQIFLDCGTTDFLGQLGFQGTKIIIGGTTTWKPSGSPFDQTRMVVARLNNLTGAVLPVRITDFAVQAKNGEALLKWSTSLEQDVDHFIIERSIDGVHFTPVGKMSAAGNSMVKQYYSFTDQNPAKGTNYYRIKTMDKNGRSENTGIRLAWFGQQPQFAFSCFPVPSKGMLNVVFKSDAASILLVRNMAGSVIKTIKISSGTGSQALDLSALPKGVYTISVEQNKVITTQQIILQ